MYFITTVFPQSEPFQVHILVYNRDSSSFIVSKQFSPDVLLANIKEPSNGMINTNVKVIQKLWLDSFFKNFKNNIFVLHFLINPQKKTTRSRVQADKLRCLSTY